MSHDQELSYALGLVNERFLRRLKLLWLYVQQLKRVHIQCHRTAQC